jgi:hypothetical protein
MLVQKLLSFLTIILFSTQTFADQVKFKTGMMSATVGGSQASSFLVVPIWNLEYEMPKSLDKSNFFSMLLANDMATAQTKYFGIAYGSRTYFRGTTSQDILLSDMVKSGDLLKVSSSHRLFYDWTLGIGQLQSYVASLSLNLTSTTVDFGGGAGYEYQLTSKTALTSKAHLGYAYGISSVAVSGMLMEITFGATWQF